jgi:hypothetical protein
MRESGISAVLLSACVLYSVVTFQFRDKINYGVSEFAAGIFNNSNNPQEIVLVSAAPQVEGMLISEMALRDREQRKCVLRASKLLSHPGNGTDANLVYHTPQQIAQFLSEFPISKVIFDTSKEYYVPQHPALREALLSNPSAWVRVDAGRASRLEVYQRTGPLPKMRTSLFVDLRQTLGLALQVPLAQRGAGGK